MCHIYISILTLNAIGGYQTGNRKSDSRWQLGSKLLPIVLPVLQMTGEFIRALTLECGCLILN